MKLSVCIESVFAGIAPEEAIKRTAAAGYEAIEFWTWKNKDLKRMTEALKQHSIKIAAFCTSSFNLTDPNLRGEYLEELALSIDIAELLGCRCLITQSGPEQPGIPFHEQMKYLHQGLESCKPLLDQSDVTLLVEPLNRQIDHPDTLLSQTQDGLNLVHELNHPQIRLLFDIYHQQITNGNLLDTILPNLELIAHFHAASVPGRHEPVLGEVHYEHIVNALAKTGYQGYLGLEYWPVADPDDSLRQCLNLLQRDAR